ncbi:MAG: mechanosensitive ion channel [Candidatus Promineifilaceae bacterium]|nr:mechanosensitive ion channel [Candidatus Promineifilaceae bacterium]
MPENSILDILSDLIGAVQHFGERVTVQRQLIVILIVLILVWMMSSMFWFIGGRRLAEQVDGHLTGWRHTLGRYSLSFARHMFWPVLVLLILNFIEGVFVGRGWHIGLLSGAIFLFWFVLAYRLLLGFLYGHMEKYAAYRYHYRFLAPLMLILVLGWMLNHLVPIRRLAAVEVWTGFSNPITLGAVFIATVGFYFWFDGSGVAQDIVRFAIRPFAKVHPGALEAGLIIGRYILIAVGIYIVFAVLGFDSTTLAFLTAGLSVGIGFGLKEVIGNLISGVLLLVDQSLRPGDVVSVDGKMGTVQHVGIRATIVNTLNNVDVVVPNQTFLTSSVTTYSKGDHPVRMLIAFETSDAHSPHDVRDAMLTVARSHPLVAAEPKPDVFYVATGDTSRQYELAVWYEDPLQTKPLHSELYYQVFDEFDKRGINPATPQRDLNINKISIGNGYYETAEDDQPPNGDNSKTQLHTIS